MTDDHIPCDQSSEPRTIAASNRLSARDSQIGNTAQIMGSPGAVVNQIQVEQSSAVTGILIGLLGVLLLLLVAALALVGKLVPGGLAVFLVGLSLALIVGGFFSWVESLLKGLTKSEIAEWLVGVKIGQKVEPWPGTFAKVFDRLFGERHLSWKCVRRSFCSSLASFLVCSVFVVDGIWLYYLPLWRNILMVAGIVFVILIFDYISLLESRYVLGLMGRWQTAWTTAVLEIVDIWLTINIMGLPAGFVFGRHRSQESLVKAWEDLEIARVDNTIQLSSAFLNIEQQFRNFSFAGDGSAENIERDRKRLEGLRSERARLIVNNQIRPKQREGQRWLSILILYIPAFFTSMWLWLYAGAGFLLKAARHFDIGFQWFNSKVDIENKPLSAIGLVAGTLVACVYWGVAAGLSLLGK